MLTDRHIKKTRDTSRWIWSEDSGWTITGRLLDIVSISANTSKFIENYNEIGTLIEQNHVYIDMRHEISED